jgi:hypothetical protein
MQAIGLRRPRWRPPRLPASRISTPLDMSQIVTVSGALFGLGTGVAALFARSGFDAAGAPWLFVRARLARPAQRLA